MQEVTQKVLTPDSELKGGLIRPKSTVFVLFTGSKHHGLPFVIEKVHPALAKKLVDAGKVTLSATDQLTDDQKKENEEYRLKQAKGKRGKVKGNKTMDEGSSSTNDKEGPGEITL